MTRYEYMKGGIVVLSLFHFMHHLYGLSLPPLFPLLKDQFGVGNVQVGLVISMISITMALFQFPFGIYSDRIGRKGILSFCLSIMIAATLLTSLSPVFWLILAFQVILGIGMSGYHPVGISAVADLSSDRGSGKAMSVQAIGGSLGVGMAPLIVGTLASAYGWRVPLRALALAGLPLLLLIIYWMEEPKPGQKRKKGTFSITFVALIIALFYFLRGFVFKSLTTFMPTYFVELRGLSLAGGGFTTSIFLLSGALVQPIGGVLADRVDRITLIVGSGLISGVMLFSLSVLPSVGWLTYLLLVLLGLSLFVSLPAVLSLVKEVSPGEEYGGAFGMNFTMTAVSGIAAPVVVGYWGDAYSLTSAFRFLPILLVLASISILLMRKRV